MNGLPQLMEDDVVPDASGIPIPSFPDDDAAMPLNAPIMSRGDFSDGYSGSSLLQRHDMFSSGRMPSSPYQNSSIKTAIGSSLNGRKPAQCYQRNAQELVSEARNRDLLSRKPEFSQQIVEEDPIISVEAVQHRANIEVQQNMNTPARAVYPMNPTQVSNSSVLNQSANMTQQTTFSSSTMNSASNSTMRRVSKREALATSKLSDFEFIKLVGTGSFGRVQIVRHRESGKIFAMKTMNKRKIVVLRQTQHINNERSILFAVSHPFIVNAYATYQDEQHIYMLMDYVPGGELFWHLRKHGKFPLEVTKFYAAEIILALGHLHSKNICYRDLKPENILINKDGHLKLSDFGFAKIVTKNTFSVCGTVEYLSPEIIKQTGHNKSADWWAVGIMIYEMLAGYAPFLDEQPQNVCKKILAGKISFPRHFDQTTVDLIVRLLNPDKNNRLGANVTTGTQDVMNHPFFAGLNWQYLERKFVKAPIIPTIKNPFDTRHYDEYLEDDKTDIMPTMEDIAAAGGCDNKMADIPESQEEIDAYFKEF